MFGSATVLKGEDALKTYRAVGALSTPTTGGLTLTEMRRLGLLAVRDNVEAQMYQDKEYLRRLQE